MNKIKIIVYFLFLSFLVLTISSCEPEGYNDIYICNDMDETIYICYAQTSIGGRLTPNMIYKQSWDEYNMIEPHKRLRITYGEDMRWDKLCILVYKTSTTDRYTTKEIRENNIIDKEYNILKYDLLSDGGLVIIYDNDDTSKW